jgi:hypothetical protein
LRPPRHGAAGVSWQKGAREIHHVRMAAMILGDLSRRDREALVRFYLKEREPDEICAELRLTRREFGALKAQTRVRFRELTGR